MDTLRAIIYFLCISTYLLGNNAHTLRKRMVGGRNPTSDEAKQYVAFVSKEVLCGGAVIDENLILTSAECVKVDSTTGKLLKRSLVIAGATDLTKRDSALVIEVAKAYIPLSYKFSQSKVLQKLPIDDIAVLELKENLRLEENSDKVEKLELPTLVDGAYPNYENAAVMAGGFGDKYVNRSQDYDTGDDYFEGWSPYQLQVGKSEIIGYEKCKMPYRNSELKESHICVRVTETYRHAGACSGDAGSPVIFDNKIVIGINSIHDNSCDTDAYPAVYTRVSSYLGFIENVKSGNTANIVTYEA